MGSNGFSSLQNFDVLKEAGFSETQARAILQMMSQDAASKADVEFATAELKRDIETLKAELKRDIETVKAELKRDIETVKAELKKDIETLKAELKRDIAELSLKMVITSGSFALVILTALVALAKLGLLSPIN